MWREDFKEVIKVKMRSYGQSLVQYDWYPYDERRLGPRHVQREDDMKTQVEDSHL